MTAPNNQKLKGLTHFCHAFCYTCAGLKAAFCGESAFRGDVALGVVAIVFAFAVSFSLMERMLLIVPWGILLATELLNSAVESVVDLVSPEWNALAKRAKDMGSAAVFCVLITWLFILICVCLNHWG